MGSTISNNVGLLWSGVTTFGSSGGFVLQQNDKLDDGRQQKIMWFPATVSGRDQCLVRAQHRAAHLNLKNTARHSPASG
jgi:hypothetical protein